MGRRSSDSSTGELARELEDPHWTHVRVEVLADPLEPRALRDAFAGPMAPRNGRAQPLHPGLRHPVRTERNHRFGGVTAPLVPRPDRVSEKERAVAHRRGPARADRLAGVSDHEEPG